MLKKGQITIFVVLGLALFAIVLFGFYFREQILQAVSRAELAQEADITEEEKAIKAFAESCMETIALTGIKKISANGGYLEPKEHIEYAGYFIPVYYNLREEKVPQLTDLQKELETYLDKNLPRCLQQLEVQGAELSGEVSSKVHFKKEIEVQAKMPLLFKQRKIQDFLATADLNIPYYFAKTISFYEEMKTKDLAFSELNEAAFEQDFILTQDVFENATLFIINYPLQEDMLRFSFAIIKEENRNNDILLLPEPAMPETSEKAFEGLNISSYLEEAP